MSLLKTIGRGLDTAVLGGTFQRAAQDREMHRLDVDRINQNMDFQRQNQIRQGSMDAIAQARALAEMIPSSQFVDPSGNVQLNLDNPKQIPGVPGFMPDVQVERPADESRRVELPMGDGRKTVLELMSGDELYRRNTRRAEDRIQRELGQYSTRQRLDDESRGNMLIGVNNAKNQADSAAREDALNRYGITVPDEISKRLGMAPGTKVLPETFKEISSSLGALQPKAGTPHYETDDRGNTTVITLDEQGNPVAKPVGRFGKSKAQPQQGSGGGDGELVQTVMANPELYQSLPPTVRTRIASALAQGGFNAFGKAPGEAAIDRMADGESALNGIRGLVDVLEKNNAKVGPIAGRIFGANPYSDMQAVRASVDLVRQRVGKAFEGGVLRKEDELKYMKILPTMEDTPENATAKAKMVAKMLEDDLRIYREAQRAGGRNVPSPRSGPNPSSSPAANRPPLSAFEGK